MDEGDNYFKTINGKTFLGAICQKIRGMRIILPPCLRPHALLWRIDFLSYNKRIEFAWDQMFLWSKKQKRPLTTQQSSCQSCRTNRMMQSKNWAKVNVLVAVLNLLILRHFVSSSSIYVGRHAAATISEHGGSEGEISEGKRIIEALLVTSKEVWGGWALSCHI